MAYDFSRLKEGIKDAAEWLSREYQGVRTGRATPALLDSVRVESYGTLMPLNQVGSISVEDARTLRITPWDASQVRMIEKAIADADFGVSVSSNEQGVRVSFPELTTERRTMLLRLTKDKLEQAKVTLRSARDETWGDIQNRARDGEFTEDEKFRYKEDMQKIVDEGSERLKMLAERKEKEITEG